MTISKGGCLCGNIRYEVNGPPDWVTVCFCTKWGPELRRRNQMRPFVCLNLPWATLTKALRLWRAFHRK